MGRGIQKWAGPAQASSHIHPSGSGCLSNTHSAPGVSINTVISQTDPTLNAPLATLHHSFLVIRADYHGSFVNLAARYAVVAAQGGQLVTDADLARQVLWHWKSSSPSSNVINVTNPQGSSKGGSMGIHSSSGHPPLPPVQHQLVSTAAGTSDISVIRDSSSSLHAAAAGPSPAAIAAESAPVGSSGGDVVVLQPSNADGATAATAAATALVPVECCWLGSFLFKGNPSPASMVTFGASVLSGRHFAAQTVSSSKGVRVLQRVGVMDRAVVELPAAVEGFGPWEDVAGGRR